MSWAPHQTSWNAYFYWNWKKKNVFTYPNSHFFKKTSTGLVPGPRFRSIMPVGPCSDVHNGGRRKIHTPGLMFSSTEMGLFSISKEFRMWPCNIFCKITLENADFSFRLWKKSWFLIFIATLYVVSFNHMMQKYQRSSFSVHTK